MAGEEFNQEVTIGGEISAAPHNDAWDNIEDWLNPRLAGGASGNLIVCDANGDPRPVGISGAINVDAAGVATQQSGTVDAVDLNNEILNDHDLLFSDSGTFNDEHLGSAVAGAFPLHWPVEEGITGMGGQRLFHYDPDFHDFTGKFTDLVMRVAVVCRGRMQTTAKLGLYEATISPYGQPANLVTGAQVSIANVADDSVTAPTGVQFDEPTAGVYGFALYFDGGTHAAMDIDVHVNLYKRRAAS